MNKPQALYRFWASFGWPAFDENTVPKGTPLPYFTYQSETDAWGNALSIGGLAWDRSTSWATVEAKTAEIAAKLPEGASYVVPIDGGYMRVWRGHPFARRIGDPDDDMIRRMVFNIEVEFLTAS